MAIFSTSAVDVAISPMKLKYSLALSVLLAFSNGVYAAPAASPAPTSTTSSSAIGSDLFADGSFNVHKTYAGNTTFTDHYNFNVTPELLQKFDTLSTSLNYTNTNSVGCAFLIFCTTGNQGFSNLTVTVSTASTTTTGTTTSGAEVPKVEFAPFVLLVTNSTSKSVLASGINLLSGNYTVAVSGTSLKDGGSYDLGITAVSEPETLAMVGLGLGVMGLISRKRKSNASSSISYNFV